MNKPSSVLKPKESVSRILVAAGAGGISDQNAFWLGSHMERFVKYVRKHGELLELDVAMEAYLAFYLGESPADWQLAQAKQALQLFCRGTEGWRWVKAGSADGSLPAHLEAGPMGWMLRYRIRASGSSVGGDPARGGIALEGAPAEMETWLEKLKRAIRLNHYTIRTEQTYLEQVKRFLLFTGASEAKALSQVHVKRYLEYLALERNVAASTQNQAFSALLFFFKRVLERELGDMEATVRAKRGRRLPEVLSREEIQRLLAMTEGVSSLMLRLLYGAGLRLMECIRLRAKEVDFDRGMLMVRDGKGRKDRYVMLPVSLREPLKLHFERLRVLWAQDRAAGLDGVWLPDALEQKYPNAGREWGWQWVFPARGVSVDPRSGRMRRHHISDNALHKAVKGRRSAQVWPSR